MAVRTQDLHERRNVILRRGSDEGIGGRLRARERTVAYSSRRGESRCAEKGCADGEEKQPLVPGFREHGAHLLLPPPPLRPPPPRDPLKLDDPRELEDR